MTGMVEIVNPSGFMVGYIFEDSIDDILEDLNFLYAYEMRSSEKRPINEHDAGGEA